MSKNKVDIIIPSDSKNASIIGVVKNCINSLFLSEPNIIFNVYIYEKQNISWDNLSKGVNIVHTIKYDEFNYNRIMNDGISKSKSNYIIMANNDLVFEKDWLSMILCVFDQTDLLSLSPREPIIHKGIPIQNKIYIGYDIRKYLCGWCIVVKRELFDIIGKLDERCDFWYSDNCYADQLKKHKIKHGLVCSSIVRHLESYTLNTLPLHKKKEYTSGQYIKYKNGR